MITENQKQYILGLYKDLDMECETYLDGLTKSQASDLIQELIALKEEQDG